MLEFLRSIWHKVIYNLSNQLELQKLFAKELDDFKSERIDSKMELRDPTLVPIEFSDLYAFEFGETLDREFSVEDDYIRSQLVNIVNKIKSKSLPQMATYLLELFKLNGDIFNLWTGDYKSFTRFPLNEISGQLYSDTGLFSDDGILTGSSEGSLVSDGLYPTHHFDILILLDKIYKDNQLWPRDDLRIFDKLLSKYRRAVKQVPHYTLQLTTNTDQSEDVISVVDINNKIIGEANVTINFDDTLIADYTFWQAGEGYNSLRDNLQSPVFGIADIQGSFELVFNADTNKSLLYKYFQFYDLNKRLYYVWYNIDNGLEVIDPRGDGIGIRVDINENDSATDIRSKTHTALEPLNIFTFSDILSDTLVLTYQNIGTFLSPYDITSGFTIDNIISGDKIQYGIGEAIDNVSDNTYDFSWNWTNNVFSNDNNITEFALYNSNSECVLYITCLPIQRSSLSSIEIICKVDK